MLDNDKHFKTKSRQIIYMMLNCTKSVIAHVWCVEWFIYFWLFWCSRPTSLSTVVMFFQYLYVWIYRFHAFGRCYPFFNFLATCPVFNIRFCLFAGSVWV